MICELSEEILLAVKKEESPNEVCERLAEYDLIMLKSELNNNQKKKAFWINTYNAFYQILRMDPKIEHSNIYTLNAITIAKKKFSLDDIEHGILRKYRTKISLGYLPNIFAKRLIKNLAVDKIDYRVHFALNCGAKSCPPIAFYNHDKINEQLEMATISFLDSETEVSIQSMEIRTTSLFSWYRGDFGGLNGIRKILTDKLGIPTKGFKIVFNPYSWENKLANFT